MKLAMQLDPLHHSRRFLLKSGATALLRNTGSPSGDCHTNQLTARERRVGPTGMAEGLAAGYSPKHARQGAHQVMKQIQKRAPEIMDEMGFSLQTLIEKYLIPELDAEEQKVFNNGGKVIYSKKMLSHDIRLRALDMAFKLRGDYAPRDPVLAAQIGVKVIVVPKELRPDREEFYRPQEKEKLEES